MGNTAKAAKLDTRRRTTAVPELADQVLREQGGMVTTAERAEKVNILLVDDRPENLLVLEGILGLLDQNLVRAASGAEALRCVLHDDFAVILMDVQMPEMDGFETAAIIRSRERSRYTPIVFVTAYEKSEAQAVHGYSLGGVDYLFKPVVPEVLIAKVRAFVDLAQKARELQSEIARRARAEDEIRRINESLEKRVAERTAKLKEVNQELRREIAERQRVAEERTQLLERERQARAEAEAANAAKDDFLAMLSHELRSPLTSILGWVRLLRSANLTDTRREHGLEVIERNTRHQSQLIDNLLDVSRIVAGKLKVAQQPVDLQKVVQDAVDSVRPTVETKGLTIELSSSADELPLVGDPSHLNQVVSNLLGNAVKFTPQGGHILVSLLRDGTEVVLDVSDSGEGIPETLLPHVFDRFRQKDLSATRSQSGLGLGLTIVRSLIEAHGGTVHAISPGALGGATLSVRLPAAICHEPVKDGSDAPASAGA